MSADDPVDGGHDWPGAVSLPHLAGTGFALRPWREADAASLANAWSDTDIRRWLDVPGTDRLTATAWIAGCELRAQRAMSVDLVIDVDGTVAGEVGITGFDSQRRAALVGYWTATGHRRSRLASSALSLITQWALDVLGADALVAKCHPDNVGSWRTAEAAGYGLIGHDRAGNRVHALRNGNRGCSTDRER